jgi:TonB family protein
VYPGSSRREFSSILARSIAAAPLFGRKLWADDSATKSDQEGKAEDADEKVYEPGGDVKSPKLVHYVEPAFSPSSKEAFVEGTVKISTVVTRAGVATKLRVMSGLNSEEDKTAVEAVKQWKFQPGTKAGQPVNVHVTVEVTFHLL